ncbi:unnamed protein product [Closterium sp. NIES-54]
MYALSFSAEGDCYQCVPPDPGIAAAALGASASSTPPGTAPAEALHSFTLDSGASRCFFGDSTTLTPLPAPVPVRLADPSGGSVVARSSTVLPCPAVPSGSLSGLHLPSFSTNLVSTAALQDAMVTTTTPGGQRVSICTCTWMRHHMATFTRRPGSSLYTLATEPPQVAAYIQVSASGQVAASCSCHLLSHQTLLWHHRLGHPSLPRLHGMHYRLLVSGLPRSLTPLPSSPAPPRLPCVEGRQRAAPHSSSFPPTTAPLQTLHMDVKGEVSAVLIPWIRTVRLQLRERFRQDLPVLCLHSDRGGEFSSDLLRDFCHEEGITQSFTLPDPPQQNGIAERRIGLVMEFARTSMIHATAPHFLWPFVVRYTAHQLNLWPHVSLPETSPTLRWTGKVGDAPVFRGPAPSGVSQVDPLPGTAPVKVVVVSCAALGAASGGAASGGAASRGTASGGAELGGAGSEGAGYGGAEPEGVEPCGAESEGAESGGATSPGAGGPGYTGAGGAAITTGAGDPTEPGEAGAGGAGAGVAGVGGPSAGGAGAAGPGVGGTSAGGAGDAGAGAVHRGARGAGGTERPRPYFVPLLQQVLGVPSSPSLPPPFLCPPPDQSQPPLQPASPLPVPSPYTEQSGGLTERREPASRPVSLVRTTRSAPRLRPPPVPGTHTMALRPSSVPLHVPLPAPPKSSLCEVPDPESDRARATSTTVARLLSTAVTAPSFESAAASALVAELLDFAAACHLDYASALVAESVPSSPPSVGGECALGTDVLEDRHEDFECLVAVVPRFASLLLAPKGDPDAPDIPTPRSYAEAITGPYSSQWQAAMDAEMASWKSTGTYVDEVPPPGANIVNGMWIVRVKQPPGSPPAFKACYVARGFSQRQEVDYFQTFTPTPKMTTLWVLLHIAAHHDYELHSLDFSTAFLLGSLHEEIWLRRPPSFIGTFPAGTQWSLRWPVYGLRQAPHEWHDTLRTTLATLGFVPSIADLTLFVRTDTSLPPFYVLVYVDDLVFATADTEALALVKSELRKRHTCTDLGELRSYLGLQITRDRARRTITLTQSHMVHQALQRFGFQYSSPQLTPLSTSHLLSAPPSCQRSTGDPRLILGKGYKLVFLGERSRVRILVCALRASQYGGVSEFHWASQRGRVSEVHWCPQLILGKGYRLVVLGEQVDPHRSILYMGPPLASAATAVLPIARLGRAAIFLPAARSGLAAVFCSSRRPGGSAAPCSARRAPRGARRCPTRRAPRGVWRFRRPSGAQARPSRRPSRRHRGPAWPPPSVSRCGALGGQHVPPLLTPVVAPSGARARLSPPPVARRGALGGRRAAPFLPPVVAPSWGPTRPPPLSLVKAPSEGARALPLLQPVRRPVLPVLGFGGGAYGGDWCVWPSLLLLLLRLPLLQLPLRGVAAAQLSCPTAEQPSSRAAQQPSRPTAEPPSRRAAQPPSRPAAEPLDGRAARQPSRTAAKLPSRPAVESLLLPGEIPPYWPLRSWLPPVSLPLMLRVVLLTLRSGSMIYSCSYSAIGQTDSPCSISPLVPLVVLGVVVSIPVSPIGTGVTGHPSLEWSVIIAELTDEGDCYLCVPPDPGIEVAALGAGEAAALGASASAAPGAGESALSGTTSAQVLHTFTLDSGASRSFFRDRTTLTPLSRPVAVSLADPSGGPVLASFSTVLPCPAAPSGTLSGLYLPSFSTNLVSGADLQDQGVDQFTPASQPVTHCTCARTGHHLATFTRRPGSSMYTLSTESPSVPESGQVVASSQVFAAASGSGPESAPCSCRLLSHQTLLWHHRLGHPSLPRLRGMASRVLVSGLPRSLPPLPPGPAPTCVPCVEGRQRAAPHSSEFPPTEAPLQTLHMDVWGPARVRGQGHERYFLLVVDDYSRYTTMFPLRSKDDVTKVLINWIRAARLQLRESFGLDFPVLRLHSDRGREFSSARLGAFCRAQGIRQTFTLPASPQKNGIAERRIGMPRVSLPETSPTLRWTGKVGDASAFRVWGSRAFVRDLSADKLSPRAIPCVFLGFPPDAPGRQFYHPTSRRVLSSQDVTFDESVPYYRLFPYRTVPLPPPPLFLAPGPPPVDPLPPQGPAPSGVSQVDAVEPVEVAVDSGAARGTEPGGAESGGAEPGSAESGGAESGGAEPGGAEPGGAESACVASCSASSRRELLSPQELREWFARRWSRAAGVGGPPVAPGPGGACTGGTGAVGTGGAAATARVGPAGASGAAGAGGAGGVGAGVGAAGASGAAGAGAPGGVDTGVGPVGGTAGAAGGTGAAGPAGVGAVGAGAVAGTGAANGGTGAVPVGTGGPAWPRPYFVPLLEQVLGLPPSPGPAPPLECPQPVQSQSPLQPVSPLPAPSPYAGPT